jgi:hypothetical protein
VRRLSLHLTLDDAYGDEPAPTFDGVSISWFDDLDALVAHATRPESVALWTTTFVDDADLFDRATSWPTDHRRAGVVGTEHIVLDGATTPSMVKAIFISSRRPGLTLDEFSTRLAAPHGALVTEPPVSAGVQTHALPES